MTILARPSEWSRIARDAAAVTPFAGGSQHYFAFISYSHRDEASAKWLQGELERFRVPRQLVGRITDHGAVPRRLTPIFRDLMELPASSDLDAEIRAAIGASQFLIVLCSPDAARSRWINAEVEYFKRVRPEGCVFAVILAGEPFASDLPGRDAEECLPRALRFKYDRRGRPTAKRAEPLAADLRETGPARRLGLLKLVAGMLAVGLDDLVHRDAVRRHRRLASIAAASILGMVVTSGLALTALQARDAARDQRREAEGLVEFMLGDLKEKLEPIGRLDALDGVGSRVLEYYSKHEDISELPDSALLQRSRALSLTAEVAYLRGDVRSADRLYREAMGGTAEAVRRDPDDPQRLYDHAQNVFWIGELARFSGRMGAAEAAYREYKRLAERMVSLEPDNLRWRMELLYGHENIGIVLFYQRRFAEAARQFARALRPMEGLASVDPGNQEYQKELSTVLAWLGDAERAQGHLESATRARERQVAYLLRLVRADAGNVDFRRQLIPAHQALGILLISTGRFDRGIEHLRRAVAEANRLIPIEPNNVDWKGLAGQARLELARTLLSLGRTDEAAAEAHAGCQLAEAVRGRESSPAWRPLQTGCRATRSRLAVASGARAEALKYAEQALLFARTERAPDPITDRYSVAFAYRLLGDVRRGMGDGDGARTAWAQGLAQLPRGAVERPWEMNTRAELLQRMGREGEARPLIAKLQAIGFRSVA